MKSLARAIVRSVRAIIVPLSQSPAARSSTTPISAPGPRELLEIAEEVYNRVMTPIEKAKRLGTYNQVDRSLQYAGASNAELLLAINHAWAKIRRCEEALIDRNKQIAELLEKVRNYRTRNLVLTICLIGLWELVKFLVELQIHVAR